MAHQTAASRSPAQFPEHSLQLGITMKKTSLAKERGKKKGWTNTIPTMAQQHTRQNTRWNITHYCVTVAARILVDGCDAALDSGGAHREGTVE